MQRRGADAQSRPERSMIPLHILVRIPIAPRKAVVGPAPYLHKPHAAFQQPPRDQAIAAEVFDLLPRIDLRLCRRDRVLLIEPVHPQNVLRLAANIEHLRRTQLHPRREFIRTNPRIEPRIALPRRLMLAV